MSALPFGEVRLVSCRRVFSISRANLGSRLDGFAAHPSLGRGAAPGVVDEADRHIEDIVQIAAVEIADGGERFHVVGRGDGPRAPEIGLQLLRAHVGHGDDAQRRRRAPSPSKVAGVGVAERPLHVGLAEHIQTSPTSTSVISRLVAPAVMVSVCGSCWRERGELHEPLAVAAGGGGGDWPAKATVTCVPARPNPRWDWRASASIHVVADDGGS